MGNVKYLYGAAVQGIQSFIFQTNELKDIVGASELVEKICTELFDQYVDDEDEIVLHAAGNIKCIFNDREHCEKAVLEFPKKVLETAPGITISQAVVKMDGEFAKFAEAVEELERKLRLQRNKPTRSLTTGMIGIKRSRHTGLPTMFIDNKGDFIDESTFVKIYDKNGKRKTSTSKLCYKSFGLELAHDKIAYDTKDLTEKNDWIAVIHADGNGLGQVVQKVGKDEKDFKDFSEKLNLATEEASVDAFNHIALKYKLNNKFPIRPIILGGDDLTVICRGDLAIDYVAKFMEFFEKKTASLSKLLGKYNVFSGGADHLTACAGVAFIKSSFPFYYGYGLAEALCEQAKKDAKKKDFVDANKGLAPSCVMFHKIQDSFVEDYKAIAKRELTPREGYSWQFGPYYIDKDIATKIDRWSVDTLFEKTKEFDGNEGNALKSHLRQWMSLMIKDENMAAQKLARVISMAPKSKGFLYDATKYKERIIKDKNEDKHIKEYPVYDMLALHSIINQVTKNTDEK